MELVVGLMKLMTFLPKLGVLQSQILQTSVKSRYKEIPTAQNLENSVYASRLHKTITFYIVRLMSKDVWRKKIEQTKKDTKTKQKKEILKFYKTQSTPRS